MNRLLELGEMRKNSTAMMTVYGLHFYDDPSTRVNLLFTGLLDGDERCLILKITKRPGSTLIADYEMLVTKEDGTKRVWRWGDDNHPLVTRQIRELGLAFVNACREYDERVSMTDEERLTRDIMDVLNEFFPNDMGSISDAFIQKVIEDVQASSHYPDYNQCDVSMAVRRNMLDAMNA